MTGHNYARAMIQKFSLIKTNTEKYIKTGMTFPKKIKKLEDFYDISIHIEDVDDKYDLSKYLKDFENMTILFANSGQKYKETMLFINRYFKIG